MGRVAILPPDIKLLYGGAAERCSFPGCREVLVVKSETGKKRQIGEMAHIVAYSDSGPRADSSYPREKKNKYENLILLCGTHHNVIDALPDKYTVDCLRKMKKNHEDWVTNSLGRRAVEIGFAELEVAIKAILSKVSMKPDPSLVLIHPTEKIAKNNLTENTHNLIVMGMSRSHVIRKYLEIQSKLDEDYPERLKEGFRTEYKKFVKDGMSGDALFESMLEFSSGYSADFNRRAAGLVILTHLFELCEIFEK